VDIQAGSSHGVTSARDEEHENGPFGNYLSALAAQPGGPEGRPNTTAGSQPIIVLGRPRGERPSCRGLGSVDFRSSLHHVPNPVRGADHAGTTLSGHTWYDKSGNYKSSPFVKDSLRRLGGMISDERIIETYIRGRQDGTAYVDVGFKRGSSRYDYNLRYNPPPNFVEIPRPLVAAFTPVFFNREDE
jgi:hypothetical protein